MNKQMNRLGLACMICGIAGILLSCVMIGILPAIAGIILSCICIIKKDENKIFYIIGLITSIITIIIFIISMNIRLNSLKNGFSDGITESTESTEIEDASDIHIEESEISSTEELEANLLSDAEIIEDDVYNGTGDTVLGKRGSITATGYDVSYGETSDFETLCEKIDSLKDDYMYFTLDFCDGTGIVFTGCDILMPVYGELDDTKALIKTIGFLRKDDNGYTYEEASQ